MFSVRGNLVDIDAKEIYAAEIIVEGNRISKINKLSNTTQTGWPYVMPGFIDSHVHIESSLLVPASFARMAVVHGTVATVSDPHEIANVCGMPGVEFMIENGKTVPFKFYFGAPSCVPATNFETAGACIDSNDVKQLLHRPEIKYLSEMMNFPGVLYGDAEVMKKIDAAIEVNKPIDGHAPGLRGEKAASYISAGKGDAVIISTDHECFTSEEALEKIKLGMKIIIREGSAAKNFEALIPLLNDYPEQILFCSDDKHPDSLELGHINQLCARAIKKGIDIFKILEAACINPIKHYKLEVGALKQNDPADFIIVNDLYNFNVVSTYINGELVAKNGESKISPSSCTPINQFNCKEKTVDQFAISASPDKNFLDVIETLDGQLITNRVAIEPTTENGKFVSDTSKDLIKIVVVNRYSEAPIASAFIKNTGLKKGALASSVAHDSHNIVAIGVDDLSLCKAVNLIIANKGGLSAVSDTEEQVLALPVAGLMSDKDGYEVSKAYTQIDKFSKTLGTTLSAPFMTLSFMALLVIPSIKLSDKGLFDGENFRFFN